jgi:hypothetical protein
MPLKNFRKSQVVVNGAVDSTGSVSRTAGYTNWIGDHVRKNFQSVKNLTEELVQTNVQLSYPVGGYSTKRFLTILGEQSSPTATINGILIPEDDYEIFLHKSQPVAQIVYSAVIIEKTNLGFTVSGYDVARPYFTIIPSQTSSNNYSISVSELGAIVYQDYENFTTNVAYGTEFNTVQQVVDFLVSYQRYLESTGVLFIDTSASLKEPMDFVLSAREFLSWQQQGWKEGSLIVLSPVSDMLKINLLTGTTDRIRNNKLRSCILDQNYNLVDIRDIDVNRYDNFTSIFCKRITTIGLVVLDVIEYEHRLVFENSTQFNDIIYQPELGTRQSRLKISGTKTDNWLGTLDAPGFIINRNTVEEWNGDLSYSVGDIVKYRTFYYVATENSVSTTFNYSVWQQIDYNEIYQTLLPNITTLATMGRDYYDINTINLNESMDSHARGLIGFRARNYFSDLGIDIVSQTKFYQGFIKSKGTPTALLALKNVQFGKLSNELEIYEDWAFRVGEYGSTAANQFIEISLQEQYFLTNPGVGVMAANLTLPSQAGAQLITANDFYKKPFGFDTAVLAQDNLNYQSDTILSAGYVDLDDVNGTIFDIQDLAASELLVDVYPSYVIWCALDYQRDWNVFRVNDSGLTFKEISNVLDQQLMIEFHEIHELSVGDVVAVKNFSDLLDGFYQVKYVTAIDTIVVTTAKSLVGFDSTTGDGIFYKLTSLRFANIEESVKFTPRDNWRDNEKIWVDNYDAEGKWAVLEKNATWTAQTQSVYTAQQLVTGFGMSIATDPTGTLLIAGSNSQKVFVHQKTASGQYSNVQTLANAYTGNVGFGRKVGYDNLTLVVGDPEFAGTGALIVYEKNSIGQFSPLQFIAPVLANNPRFGFSFVLSTNYLVVGAPGINTIFIYKKESITTASFSVVTPQPSITLPFAITSIIIKNTLGTIISPRTYSVTGSTITFSVVPLTAFTVYQGSYYYRLVQVINDTAISGLRDQFGYSVEINATEDKIYVGAPYAGPYDLATQKFVYHAGRVIAYTLYQNNFQFLQTIEAAQLERNGEFGSSIRTSSHDMTLFVGSPGVSFPSTYNSGQVYRFVNLGQTVGFVVSNKFTGSLVGAGSLVINGVNIPLSGNISNIKTQIDAAGLADVSTTFVDQILTIKSSSLIEYNKLTVLPGSGSAFTQLGLKFLTQAQVIPNPINRNLSRFGEEIDLSINDNQLFVSSPRATSIIDTEFDLGTTVFDSLATVFQDEITDSGSVSVFEFIKPLNPTITNLGSYIFGQQLESVALSKGDLFGSSLAVSSNTVFVGAPEDDIFTGTDDRGRVQIFESTGTESLWEKIKYKQPLVNVDKINRVYIYNKKTNNVDTTLDIIDPLKGRVLGIAQQYLDYVESQDPAAYNRSSGIDSLGPARISSNNYWTDTYIGRYWLDTSQIRFFDYEQQDLLYRKNNWNQLFPGSEVRVYQWVESDQLPSLYSKFYSGTPKYMDDESYVISYVTDKNTGAVTTKYYFWVRNYDTKPDSKPLSTATIEQYITDPKASGIPYIAFYSPNSFGLYNIDSYIDSDNYINTDINSGNTILHIEYELIANDNLIHAEYALVQENNILSAIPGRIIKKFIDSLAGQDAINNPVPDPLLNVSERYGLDIRPRQTLLIDRLAALKVLVTQANLILSYLVAADRIIGTDFFYKNGTQDVTKFWKYAPWRAKGYDLSTPIQYTVAKYADLQRKKYPVGSIVKVTNDGQSYVIVKITASGFEQQVQENGTIELSNEIYSAGSSSNGIAVRKLLESLFYQIFIEDYAIYAKDLFFVLIKYALREQKNLDWVFKTSFITVDHLASQFEKYPNYQPDNTEYLVNYINEAKPYHTKIREYRPRYGGLTEANITATDFDVPAYYDQDLKLFRSPSGELENDTVLWDSQPQYQDWHNNYKLGLKSVSIGQIGTGYTDQPTITVSGGGGTGATVRAFISNSIIKGIIVTNPGSGYTSTPTITVTRAATDQLLNARSIAFALADKVLGKPIDTALNTAFETVVGGYRLGDLTNSGVINQLDATWALRYSNNELVGTKLATTKTKMTAIQNYLISQNNTKFLNVDVKLFPNMKNDVVRQFYVKILFDRVWYRATTGSVGFDVNLFDDDDFDNGDPAFRYQNALDRVRQYYSPMAGQSGIDYGQLFAGVNYPGYDIHGADFNVGGGYDRFNYEPVTPILGFDGTLGQNPPVDMVIQSAYQDLLLGTRAEDITFDGGQYVDPAHSHAPEELLPGIIFDTLEMRVFHKFADSAVPNVTFRMFKNLIDQFSYYRMSADNATTLSQPLLITDTEIAVVSAAVLEEPNPAVARPGVIFIRGERITYFERDVKNNRLRRIRRGSAGTGAPAVHATGSPVVAAGQAQAIENAHNKIWYDPLTGLETSQNPVAEFLKEQPPVSVS